MPYQISIFLLAVTWFLLWLFTYQISPKFLTQQCGWKGIGPCIFAIKSQTFLILTWNLDKLSGMAKKKKTMVDCTLKSTHAYTHAPVGQCRVKIKNRLNLLQWKCEKKVFPSTWQLTATSQEADDNSLLYVLDTHYIFYTFKYKEAFNCTATNSVEVNV